MQYNTGEKVGLGLTFPVQELQLLLELVHQAADGGAEGSQVEVGVDADR